MEKTQKLIAESWRRCQKIGLKQSEGYPTVVVTGKDLEQLLQDSMELIDAARPLRCGSLRLHGMLRHSVLWRGTTFGTE